LVVDWKGEVTSLPDDAFVFSSVMQFCLYELAFSVRKLPESQYEIYGVASASLAYRVGIRNGDYTSGFNYVHEDGRTKSHEWREDTFDEVKQLGLVFVLVQKKERLSEAEELFCTKRDAYVSQIKVHAKRGVCCSL